MASQEAIHETSKMAYQEASQKAF